MSKRSLPWLQFYPADWESDSIAGCTLSAQGLWLRMLCVMHTSRSYGYLEIEGKAIPDEMMFRRCGCSTVEEYRGLLAELFTAGVPSRKPDGVIYSRRMVRDQQERDSAADRQRLHRCHAAVTPVSQGEVRSQSQKSEVREKQHRAAKPAAPADPRFQLFVAFAHKTFEEKHRAKPSWLAKDFSHLKALLKANATIDSQELESRWRAYLESSEPFTVKQGDSLAYFATHCDTFSNGPISQRKGNGNGKDINDAVETTMRGWAENAGIRHN